MWRIVQYEKNKVQKKGDSGIMGECVCVWEREREKEREREGGEKTKMGKKHSKE